MRVLNRRGSAIPLVMIITALVGVFSYVIFGLLESRRQNTEDDLRILQAKMLAADIAELGKYMVLYERVIFKDDILSISSKRKAIRQDFLNQSYGSLNAVSSFMMNACGGYDANAVEVGNLVADDSPVFCPYYLRNPLMDGKMFEDMMLRMWSSGGEIQMLEKSGGMLITSSKKYTRKKILARNADSGAFTIEIPLEKALQSTDNQYIRLHLNQNIVKTMKQGGFSASLKFTLYGPSSGYKTLSNERFVTIQADVSFGSGMAKKFASVAETTILYSSVVKDFALFMMYPEKSNGVPTKKFSEAVALGAGSQINGRVLFNGDIDTALENLPTFNEAVIISGTVNTAGYSFEKARELMAKKFRKGVVMGFPIKLLINDNACVAGMPTANDSSMFCFDDTGKVFSISDYILALPITCKAYPVKFKDGSFTYTLTGVTDPAAKEACKGSAPGKFFLSGGVNNTVTVSGSHAYIVSPIKKLILGSGSSVYGTIFGGYVKGGDVRIFSLGALRTGLPGLDDKSILNAVTSEAALIQDGVGVPLVNVSLIKEANLGQ